jgi:hypothetical protein
MLKLSLDEIQVLLSKFKYVLHDDIPFKMTTFMNEEGLVIKLKSTIESVMLFPYDKNQEVELSSNNFIILHDGMNWKQEFYPLVPGKLFK